MDTKFCAACCGSWISLAETAAHQRLVLEKIAHALPPSFYAHLTTIERVNRLVMHWQRAVEILSIQDGLEEITGA